MWKSLSLRFSSMMTKQKMKATDYYSLTGVNEAMRWENYSGSLVGRVGLPTRFLGA